MTSQRCFGNCCFREFVCNLMFPGRCTVDKPAYAKQAAFEQVCLSHFTNNEPLTGPCHRALKPLRRLGKPSSHSALACVGLDMFCCMSTLFVAQACCLVWRFSRKQQGSPTIQVSWINGQDTSPRINQSCSGPKYAPYALNNSGI